MRTRIEEEEKKGGMRKKSEKGKKRIKGGKGGKNSRCDAARLLFKQTRERRARIA